MIKGYGLSDIGKVRKRNEDLFLLKLPCLAAVADGMGGHQGGLEASQIAIQIVEKKLIISPEYSKQEIEEKLDSIVQKANQAIFVRAKEDQSLSGMGTTLSIIYIVDKVAYWAHVGDSRIYLIQNQICKQITRDHTLSSQNSGKSHVLTRALGVHEEVVVDIGCFPLSVGDKIFLCTDGLYDQIDEKEMIETLDKENPIEKLIEKANDTGGKDNSTGVLLWIES